MSTHSVPFLVLASTKLSLKCLCLPITQIHLHVLVFKAWQLPQIKRTTPCLECLHFPKTYGEQSVSWLGYLHSQGTKQNCHHRHYLQVTHWLLLPLFWTPKETTNFYGRHLQQRLLQKSYSCENDPMRVIPASRLCSYPGFMAKLELPLTGLEWSITENWGAP